MNDQVAPTPTTESAVPPLDRGPAPSAVLPSWLKPAVGLVLLGTLGVAWLSWQTHQRAGTLEEELVRRQQDSQAEVVEARVAAKQAQELARDAAARATLLEARVAEVALQRTQVEELIRSVNLSRDEALVAEIESALRVASQQSALMGSAEPMILALQTAQERLERVQQPTLENVRRALAKDLERLRSTRVADLATLSLRLDDATRLVDEVRLLNAPPAQEPRRTPSTSPSVRDQSVDQGTTDPATSTWTAQAWQWTQGVWWSVWDETRNLIRLSRIDHPESVLIAPEEGFFLRENTKLRLLNARLALLSRQTPTALNDLAQVQAVLPRYFDMRSSKGQRLAQTLQDISTQARQTTVPRPDDTLAALAAVSGLR